MVNIDDRNFLHFFCWKDGNLDNELIMYGMTSSSGCANIGLKTTADDYERECESQAANFVRNNFYVDDRLKSASSSADAIDLILKTRTLCKKEGFRLHKIISNSKQVIEAVPLMNERKVSRTWILLVMLFRLKETWELNGVWNRIPLNSGSN